MTQKIIKLSYESLNDQRLTGLGCDLYIVSSNGIGFPAHASVVCSQSDVFQVLDFKELLRLLGKNESSIPFRSVSKKVCNRLILISGNGAIE